MATISRRLLACWVATRAADAHRREQSTRAEDAPPACESEALRWLAGVQPTEDYEYRQRTAHGLASALDFKLGGLSAADANVRPFWKTD